MKSLRILFTALLVFGAVLALLHFTATDEKREAREPGLKGQLICLGCELQCKDGDSACDYYPHIGVLRTPSNELWYFEETPAGKELISDKKLRGKTIVVYGDIDAPTHHIRVKSYRILSE